MRTTANIIRVLLGALFIFGSVAYFFKLIPQPELSGEMKAFQDGLDAAGYLMPLVKALELICGIAFISGRFVPLAVVVVFPISVNILLVHVFLAPEGLPVALFVIAANVLLAYQHKTHYKALVSSRS